MRFSTIFFGLVVGIVSVAATAAPSYGTDSILEVRKRCFPDSCVCNEDGCSAGPPCCANGSCPC
ncbi:hypothetical protein GALMADRAFT_255923 [Galerina marginata CBS 339.88]|uniref:WAP domain-containing protein n=1 Tax=Galerina marginata (strain CBS 339.88) TaxID=685588 RepID=A0A067SHI3_GALM3|nr:hypothetical protein GALMADRAFT_255923 [Galerina marginata CBS 339.88]